MHNYKGNKEYIDYGETNKYDLNQMIKVNQYQGK